MSPKNVAMSLVVPRNSIGSDSLYRNRLTYDLWFSFDIRTSTPNMLKKFSCMSLTLMCCSVFFIVSFSPFPRIKITSFEPQQFLHDVFLAGMPGIWFGFFPLIPPPNHEASAHLFPALQIRIYVSHLEFL